MKKSIADKKLAQQFGKDFFDGDRSHGYGGFNYDPKYWENVVPTFKNFYKIKSNDKILDVGCAKGFMLYDFLRLIPGIKISGIDISSYAINNSINKIKPFLNIGNAISLPFKDNEFDFVISINTIHNLDKKNCAKALGEIQRVSSKGSFITVDAYRNDEEKKRMEEWNLTAKTIMHVDEWKDFFQTVGYNGDYYWFIP